MHEKDREKIMAAGFILYRCSEVGLVVKRRTCWDSSWKIESRHKTKEAIKLEYQRLLKDPKVIKIK